MFQFKCPAGHLVQADESHVGQTSSCPTCGIAMIIPGATTATAGNPEESFAPGSSPLPRIQTEESTSPVDSNGANGIIPALNSAPAFYHIPCPNGHPLETPAEMIGEYARCPTCGAEFDLREEDSEEFQRRKEMIEESELANLDRKWLNRSIAIVILVAVGAIGLVIATVLNK